MTPTTEERIHRGLEGIGEAVETPAEPYVLVRERIERRRRRRHARNGALAGVASIALVVAGVVATRDDSTNVDTANRPGVEAPAAGSADPSTASDFPKVSIELDGVELVQASVQTEPSPTSTAEQAHLQVFRPPGATWSLPIVQVLTGTEHNMGIGRENPDAELVDVNGVDGYLDTREDDTTAVGLALADGTHTLVLARGIGPETAIDLARSMQKRAGGPGWDVPQISSLGLVQSADGSPRPPEGQLEFHTLQFEGLAGAVELNASTASAVAHESRVVDYLAAGDVEIDNSSVLGHPAVIARGPHDVRVLWYDADREVSSYLIVTGELRSRIDDLVGAIVELDDARWADLLARTDPYRIDDDGTTEPPTTFAPPSPETVDAAVATITALLPEYTNATEIARSPGVVTIRVTDLDDASFSVDVYALGRFAESEMAQLEELPPTQSGRVWLGADDADLRSVYLLSGAGEGIRVESAARDGSALHSMEALVDLADQLASHPAIAELRSEIGD